MSSKTPPTFTKAPGSQAHLKGALRACTGALSGIALLSCVINIMALTGSFFMLEVYDRVIPSRSVPTLVSLVLIAAFLYFLQGALEAVRARLLARVGLRMDEILNQRVYASVMVCSIYSRNRNNLMPLRDLDQVRAFCSGMGLAALFDLPWMPIYLVICFLFHPLIGAVSLFGVVALFGLTVLTELATRGPNKSTAEASERRMAIADAAGRNAESIFALGMNPAIASYWDVANATYTHHQRKVSDTATALSTVSRVFRTLLQSGMLAVGAYLVIEQQATGGIMIASSILMSRTLAPIELAIGNWGPLISARRSWKRLNELFLMVPEETEKSRLPGPRHALSINQLRAVAPGSDRLVLRDITFELKAGEALGIVGHSGCGKSSLVRLLVGAWRPLGGKITLDGAGMDQWEPAVLGKHIGYLPQDIELLTGSIAQNIGRFDPDASMEDIIAAAEEAKVHDMILAFPGGYDMDVGDRGCKLSAGQRQRIALARALFGRPFLIVLDEPNSNLDGEGEHALSRAILSARVRGAIVIVVAHRPTVLAHVGRILVLRNGTMEQLDDRDAVMSRILQPGPAPQQQPQPVRAADSVGADKPPVRRANNGVGATS